MLEYGSHSGGINPRGQVARTDTFFTVAPNLVGPQYPTSAPSILNWLLHFWKTFGPLVELTNYMWPMRFQVANS
jgi:hypothetical protein